MKFSEIVEQAVTLLHESAADHLSRAQAASSRLDDEAVEDLKERTDRRSAGRTG